MGGKGKGKGKGSVKEKPISIREFLSSGRPEGSLTPAYTSHKPAYSVFLLINGDGPNTKVRPNTEDTVSGKMWKKKLRHARLYREKGEMSPLLVNNVKGKGAILRIVRPNEGYTDNKFNYAQNSVNRLILEFATRINQFNPVNPHELNTNSASKHAKYLDELRSRAVIASYRVNGSRREALSDMLAWFDSNKGHVFRMGG